MPDTKKLKGPQDPSEGRPDPNPSGDKPATLTIPKPPPTGPKDLKAPGAAPTRPPSKPSKG